MHKQPPVCCVPASIRSPLIALFCLLLFVSPARGEEDDLRSLELYNGAGVDVVSADRSPRPASQTAENTTVITAKEIEALNAHTLADVLSIVTGIQVVFLRTPGSFSYLQIQGANPNHILVLIDNIPINSLVENVPDIGSVPVQMIERVEIIKGAASSSWGSALGGVVNVITKSPLTDRPFGGLASASVGKRGTADGRAELSGTLNRFGYYLTGGKLRSDGLLQNNQVDLNSVYGKLNYELPVRGSLSLTTGLTDSASGQIGFETVKADQESRQLIATLSMQYPVTDRLSVQGMLRTRQSRLKVLQEDSSVGFLDETRSKESASGASLMVSWLDDLQRIVAGVDYDYVKAHVSQPLLLADRLNNSADRFGVYLNDTFTFGAFAVTPSGRFDHTGSGGDLFSPSFGITYALSENSVLRGYTARGYSLTSLNRSDSTEKVWTSQMGFESGEIHYLWLKGTLFRNETWNIDAQNPDGSASIVKQRELKQGYEVEARTLPFLAASLSLGYTFVDARHGGSGTMINGVARHAINFGIKYEDSRYLRALLTGRYIDWNTTRDESGTYNGVVWDLFLGKKIAYSENGSIELFLSVRNLFNVDQYLSVYKNAGRWGEVGVRWAF